jgi:hypothetical protein
VLPPITEAHVLPRLSRGDSHPDHRDLDVGEDGPTINPSDFDRLIARHRAISEAERNLARILDEVAKDDEAEHLDEATGNQASDSGHPVRAL